MPHITLYIPNGGPEEYDVESYGFNDGRLHFTVGEGADAISVATTVPYLIRQPVKAKAVTTQSRPARRTSSSATQWS